MCKKLHIHFLFVDTVLKFHIWEDRKTNILKTLFLQYDPEAKIAKKGSGYEGN